VLKLDDVSNTPVEPIKCVHCIGTSSPNLFPSFFFTCIHSRGSIQLQSVVLTW